MVLLDNRVLSGSIYDAQIKLETEANELGAMRYQQLKDQAIKRGEGCNLKPAERLLLWWFDDMTAAIRKELREIRAGKPGKGRSFTGPYLLAVHPEKLAVLTLHRLISDCMLHSMDGVKMVKLANRVGRGVMAEVNLKNLKSNHKEVFKQFCRAASRIGEVNINQLAARVDSESRLSTRVKSHIGSTLVWLAIQACSVNVERDPFICAFQHRRRYGGRGRHYAYINLHPLAMKIIDQGNVERQHLRPRYMPMICPPLPWTKYRQGGYIKHKVQFIRKSRHEQKRLLDQADLSLVRSAVDALSATEWRINKKILTELDRIWCRGGEAVGLPRRDDLPIPPRPEGIDSDPKILKKWKKDASRIYRDNAVNRGSRFEFGVYRLPLAKRFAKYNRFWLCHNLDFRSRAYPVPAFNHQGDDINRGLLEFARGHKLTKRGEFWLKVHAANCFGQDKLPYQDRVGWVDSYRIDQLRAMWDQAEKPWQFLAAVFALQDVADGKKCYLPVQVDATASGLQHYAALGRDPVGAHAVNLMSGSRPEDLYSHIATKTRALVAADSGVNTDIFNAVTRRVCKQPVMTSLYGVTRTGARRQVHGKLKDGGFDNERLAYAAGYIARKVDESLKGVCVAAGQIMDWLTTCARIIANSHESVRWTTPLGMPVVQPYRNTTYFRVATICQKITLPHETEDDPIAVGRQTRSVAPNFIHSIDGSHMLLVALEMGKQKMPLAAVHDSFWSHPNDMDFMQRTLRRTFVDLHEQPILENLHKEWCATYKNLALPPPPARGNLDIECVLASDYCFS